MKVVTLEETVRERDATIQQLQDALSRLQSRAVDDSKARGAGNGLEEKVSEPTLSAASQPLLAPVSAPSFRTLPLPVATLPPRESFTTSRELLVSLEDSKKRLKEIEVRARAGLVSSLSLSLASVGFSFDSPACSKNRSAGWLSSRRNCATLACRCLRRAIHPRRARRSRCDCTRSLGSLALFARACSACDAT